MRFAAALLACLLAAAAALPAAAQQAPGMETALPGAIRPVVPVTARDGMVVAQERLAAQIGADVLRRGGNAVDAAVAVGFTLAVTYPRAGNLGGGGFMVIHLADGRDVAIDYREMAPAAATPDMFLDAAGEPDADKSRDSALAAGVPGTVAGLSLALAKYGSGRFTLAELLAPAIAYARDGIAVADDTADTLPAAAERLGRWPASRRIFFAGGAVLAPGAMLRQPDLAATLSAIAASGPDGFYRGAVAEKIAAAVQAQGGLITAADLAAYQAVERAPVRGTYRGYDIVSMPPPSSGGVHLIEMLNLLEGFALKDLPPGTQMHVMIEAMRRAYADRAAFMGDPDKVAIPLRMLLSKDYAAKLRAGIDAERATPSTAIRPELLPARDGDNTTHFSVMDRFGNAVANTYTLNFSYGLGLVAEGTGVLLNNEMDDFAARAGASNAFGLIGGAANLPGPRKRPLSSMTPTIVLRDGRPVLVLGAPGGSRIITAVLQVVSRVIDGGMPLDAAVAQPRLHHQWLPDEVWAEPGVDPDLLAALAARGHIIRPVRPGTAINAIAAGPDGLIGAADSRTRGALAVGP